MRIRAIIVGAGMFALGACGGGSDEALTGAALGEKLFTQCAICHIAAAPGSPGAGTRLVGPNLYGVYERPSATVDGFDYSPAMRAANVVWDEATLDAFIAHPQEIVRGNRMSFAGEPDAEKRAAIIAYLKTLK